MKEDNDGIALMILGLIVSAAVFLGVVVAIKSAFKKIPSFSIESSKEKTDQEKRMEEIAKRKKRLMEEREQRMRDFRNRN